MSTIVKTLIVIWMIIGFLVVGIVGFYLGRITMKTQPETTQPFPGNNQFTPPTTFPTGGQLGGPSPMEGAPGGQRREGQLQQPSSQQNFQPPGQQ
jgi:hypothetical protein